MFLALEALHDPGEDFALAVLEFVINLFALGVADMLDEVLLGRLRCNTTIVAVSSLIRISSPTCASGSYLV